MQHCPAARLPTLHANAPDMSLQKNVPSPPDVVLHLSVKKEHPAFAPHFIFLLAFARSTAYTPVSMKYESDMVDRCVAQTGDMVSWRLLRRSQWDHCDPELPSSSSSMPSKVGQPK